MESLPPHSPYLGVHNSALSHFQTWANRTLKISAPIRAFSLSAMELKPIAYHFLLLAYNPVYNVIAK